MLKLEDIRKMKTTELVTKSNELREEIAEMRRRIHMGETQNPRVLRTTRRDLARVLTVLSEELTKERA
jgi:large subunit ribosomal protein L29